MIFVDQKFGENGYPYSYGGDMICPYCSKFTHKADEYNHSYREITNPVFLVVRVNKTSGVKFLGCPNFPNCKHSDDTASTKREKTKRKIYEIDWEDELRPY